MEVYFIYLFMSCVATFLAALCLYEYRLRLKYQSMFNLAEVEIGSLQGESNRSEGRAKMYSALHESAESKLKQKQVELEAARTATLNAESRMTTAQAMLASLYNFDQFNKEKYADFVTRSAVRLVDHPNKMAFYFMTPIDVSLAKSEYPEGKVAARRVNPYQLAVTMAVGISEEGYPELVAARLGDMVRNAVLSKWASQSALLRAKR
jgi:hypothetical protein